MTNLILAVIISGYVDSLVMLHILVLNSKNLWKNIQGQNSKYFFFFPLRKMMLLVRHRWPIFHFPWCCYPLSGGYLLQPKICIIPLFFKITDLHLHTLLENLKLCPKIQFSENEKNCEFEFSYQKSQKISESRWFLIEI